MSSNDESTRSENAGRSAYDGRTDVRFAAIETRIAAVEVDLAVIRNSFATKDDVQRIIAMFYEHSLEFANRRADFHGVQAQHREEFIAALAVQKEYFNAALSPQRIEFNTALLEQRIYFDNALAQLRIDFNNALAKQQVELHKAMMGHIWKLYGSASLLIAGVYFIARYVH